MEESARRNVTRSSHRWRIALRRATSSASAEISMALICASVRSPRSRSRSRLNQCRYRGRAHRRSARNCSAASTTNFRLRPRNENRGRHLEIEREEFLAPDDVGERLARFAARDHASNFFRVSVDRSIDPAMTASRETPAASRQENFRIEARRIDAGRREHAGRLDRASRATREFAHRRLRAQRCSRSCVVSASISGSIAPSRNWSS